MSPEPQIHGVLRYGAFLPTIEPDRRIGDYVHATARIANILLSRLEGVNAALTSVVRDIRSSLSIEASQVSVEDRIGWRPRTPNQIDLTQAKIFMDNLDYHRKIVDSVRKKFQYQCCTRVTKLVCISWYKSFLPFFVSCHACLLATAHLLDPCRH